MNQSRASIKELIIFFSSSCLTGFSLHLAWEYGQCALFFVHLSIAPTLLTMVSVSLGDLGILWFAYLMVSVFKRSLSWGLGVWGISGFLGFVSVSSILVELLEYRAIHLGLWSYTSKNLTFPWVDISMIPVLQMTIVNPIVLSIARMISLRSR